MAAGRALPLSPHALWLLAALPLAGFLFIGPSTDRAPRAAQLPSAVTAAPGEASGAWQKFQAGLADRAAITLRDDFRAGLRDWTGSGDWSTSWSFDRGGLARPGKLALYKPSMSMSDYSFEFSVHIERGGFGWACRAQDDRNYQAMKLQVEAGDSPNAALVRYRVENGKPAQRTRTPLPLLSRRSMLDVRLDARGADLSLYLDGRLVEHWSDVEDGHGGVGFFADPGERARLAWVTVTHQYDLLGRLCALLAPARPENAIESGRQ
ncbi:MAG: hypothetical protein KIT09_20725 [Bryobacteraceae bacterium]|nr:hypothetical protein [Bryobacteraceae bacterium]